MYFCTSLPLRWRWQHSQRGRIDDEGKVWDAEKQQEKREEKKNERISCVDWMRLSTNKLVSTKLACARISKAETQHHRLIEMISIYGVIKLK